MGLDALNPLEVKAVMDLVFSQMHVWGLVSSTWGYERSTF